MRLHGPAFHAKYQRGARRRFPAGFVYRCWIRIWFNMVMFRRYFRFRRPLRKVQFGIVALMLGLGAALAVALLLSPYDRALVLSGRTEVVTTVLGDAPFGVLGFDDAVYRSDPDTAAATGHLQIEVAPGTTVRFVRIGHGPARITFAAGSDAPLSPRCGPGGHTVGTTELDGAPGPLCETALIQLPLASGSQPIVIGLSGDLTVGEEVSQGAGSRPILLEATAALLVRHQGLLFRRLCRWDVLEHVCERFTAAEVALAPGNSVRAESGHGSTPSGTGLGFLRIDPSEVQSGMLFNLAAPATAFAVTRMEGETFTVRESLFEVIAKSPLIRTLNAFLVALGVAWFFLRLGEKQGGEGSAAIAILAGAWLLAPVPAHAQQALLKADEVGQAMLRARGDRCYAITVNHLMGQETTALVTAPGRERGEGDLLRRLPAAPEPIALLTIRGLPAKLCPPFEGPLALDDLLQSSAAASLRLVRADGSVDRVPLLVGSIEVETIEVKAVGAPLMQGMSGGTVLVADRPIGLLVDVSDEGQTGRVMRLDRMFERLAPHLATGVSVQVPMATATGDVPYEIIRSTGAPVALENKVSSLQGDGQGPWRVTAEARVELVLKVDKPVTGVTLNLTGLPDPPRSVEVLGGRSEHGPWQSLAALALEPGDTTATQHFPATRLTFVLIRIAPAVGEKTMAVTRLSLIDR